jgi:hypothetical protein
MYTSTRRGLCGGTAVGRLETPLAGRWQKRRDSLLASWDGSFVRKEIGIVATSWSSEHVLVPEAWT